MSWIHDDLCAFRSFQCLDVSCLFVLSVSCGGPSTLCPHVSPLALRFVSVVVRLVQCQVYMPEVPVSVSELCFLFYFESPWSSVLCHLVVVSSLCAVCSLILATVLLTLYSLPKFLSLLVLSPESWCAHRTLDLCPTTSGQPVLPRRGNGTQQPIKAPLLHWAVVKV